MNVHQTRPGSTLEEVDLFEMANLHPKHTGLPMTVWVSPKGHARHDARVKVCRAHGAKMDINDTAVVSVRPSPKLLEGALTRADLNAVHSWIELNQAALLGYWDGVLDTVDFVQRLKKV